MNPSTMDLHAREALYSVKAVGLSLLLVMLATIAEAAASEPMWQLSADGGSVVVPTTQLAWDRCVHGQRWNGKTCEGEVLLLSHAEGMALASERSRTSGKSCRIPSVVELKSMAAQSAASQRPVLFPPAGSGLRWAGTRIVDTANVNPYNYGNVMQGRNNENALRIDVVHGWAVDVATGEARKDITKRSRLPVQLVCALR